MADWMSDSQREDYETVCNLIDSVTTPREFYRVCDKINSGRYDFDIVAMARRDKNFNCSAQYGN